MNLTMPIPENTPARRCPGHLLVLACDAALRYLAAAETGMAGGNARAGAADVRKAQRILLELMGALDPAIAPEATDALAGLYQHLFDRLGDPAAATDPTIVREARRTLGHIRTAWAGGWKSESPDSQALSSESVC